MSAPLKLVAYNTSFANDAHYSQLHPGLSESAAIVAKAIDIYTAGNNGNAPNNFDELTKTLMDEKYMPDDIKKDIKIQNAMKQKLGYLRMGMADAATDYIKKDLSTTGFVALIEQMIHVPESHQAYYGGVISKANLDKFVGGHPYMGGTQPSSDEFAEFTGKNKNFGILRRISRLGSVDDVDGNGYEESPSSTDKTHVIVYDNLVNITNPFGAAEGIAIIVKNDLYNGELLKWKASEHPNKIKGNESKIPANIEGTLHYFSDDFGQVVANEPTLNVEKVCKIAKALDGLPDYGRPIILTAGIKGTELNVFVAIHSLNIFNLVWLDDKFIRSNTTDFNDEKLAIIKEFKKSELLKIGKSEKDADTEIGKMTKGNSFGSTVNYCSVTSVDEISELFKESKLYKIGNSYGNPNRTETENKNLTSLYDAVYEQLGNFIQSAFNSLDETEKTKLSGITKVNLFLGGDFNDPEGEILKRLITKELKLKLTNKPDGYTITFKTDITEDKIKDLVKSCCANRDSQTKANRELESNKNLGATVGSLEVSYSRNSLINKDSANGTYPEDFHRPKSFGYNGDYIVFGTSGTSDEKYGIVVDDTADTAKIDSSKFPSGDKLIIASDHLPVYAKVDVASSFISIAAASAGGGRRRVSPRRKTRKGLMKLKKSRRH